MGCCHEGPVGQTIAFDICMDTAHALVHTKACRGDTITAAAPSTARMTLDASRGKHGAFVVDGLPYFPVGSYEDVRTFQNDIGNWSWLETAGNFISVYVQPLSPESSSLPAYLDRCHEMGITALVHLAPLSELPATNSSKVKLLTDFINSVKDHPALLGYYIADEPDAAHAKPPFRYPNIVQHLEDTYRIIKQVDPVHPVALLVNNPAAMHYFVNATDIGGSDPYPCGVPPDYFGPVGIAGSQVNVLNKAGRPALIAPYAFGGSSGCERFPDPAEERVMAYLAAMNGAVGLQFFIHRIKYGPPASWNAALDVGKELAEMASTILAPRADQVGVSVVSKTKGVEAAAWLDLERGILDVAVANVHNVPTAISLVLMNGTAIPAGTVVEVLFQDRTLVVEAGGVLSDVLSAYGTAAYRLVPPALTAGNPALVKGGPPAMAGRTTNSSGLVNPTNIFANPSFEQSTTVGFADGMMLTWAPPWNHAKNPNNCSFSGRADVDARTAVDGLHSLRLLASRDGCGVEVKPIMCKGRGKCTATPTSGATYEFSVWAKSAVAGLELDLIIRAGVSHKVSLTTEWARYSVTGTSNVYAALKQLSEGTVWIDLLQLAEV